MFEDDYEDKYCNIQKSWFLPEKIVSQLNKGKYYLVKWQNLDYVNCTWERQDFCLKHFKELVKSFIRQLETQKMVRNSKQHRLELIRGRDTMLALSIY